MDLTESAIEKIERLSGPQLINGGEGRYYSKSSHDLKLLVPPMAKAMEVFGLESVCDYVKANRDEIDLKELIIHVVSPSEVLLRSPLNDYEVRDEYVKGVTANPGIVIGQFMSAENMTIMLASSFVDNEDRAKAIAITGNVTDALIKTVADDGLSQEVTVKQKLGREGQTEINKMFKLAPYRTFPEIEQPVSQFILRAKKGQGLPEFALFQFGGDLWKLEAMREIKTYLKNNLKEVSSEFEVAII